MDIDEGYSFESGLVGAWLSDPTNVVKTGTNKWLGTWENGNTGVNTERETLWVEVKGSASEPLQLTYYGNGNHGSAVNYYGNKVSYDFVTLSSNSQSVIPNGAEEPGDIRCATYGLYNVVSADDMAEEGYIFSGWYTDEALTQKAGSQIIVNEDKFLYGTYFKAEKTAVVPENTEDSTVKVGQTIQYSITFSNPENTEADIILTDVIPTGTTYKDGSAAITVNGADFEDKHWNYKDDASGALTSFTITLKDVPARANGVLTFEVSVNESALKKDAIDGAISIINSGATVQIGENGPKATVNTTENPVRTGNLNISKAVETNGSKSKEFTYTLALKDVAGNLLTGTYNYTGTGTVTDGENGEITIGQDGQITVALAGGQDITLTNLPEGASYTILEDEAPGWTISVSQNEDEATEQPASGIEGQIDTDTQKVSYINAYSTEGSLAAGEISISKELSGRDWTDSDSFVFEIAGESYTPPADTTYTAPEKFPLPQDEDGNPQTTVTATKDEQTASFGEISYTIPGTYTYTVTEQDDRTDKTDLSYDTTIYSVTVLVEDDDEGKLTASILSVADSSGTESEADSLSFINSKPVKTVSSTKDKVNGATAYVGDELTYRISFVNTGDLASDITISDTVPTYTVYVEDSISCYINGDEVENAEVKTVKSGGKVTAISVKLEDVPARADGMVSFKVTVDEDTLKNTIVNDAATVQIGENTAAVSANTVKTTITETKTTTPGTDYKTGSSAGTATNSVKTGDETDFVLPGIFLAASLGVIVVLILQKKRGADSDR